MRCRDTPTRQRSTVHDLRLAVETGTRVQLATLFHPRVELIIDGGGVIPSDPGPFVGPTIVAAKICEVLAEGPAAITEREINGQSGLVLTRQGTVTAVVGVRVHRRLVTDLWVVLNPEKLRHWS